MVYCTSCGTKCFETALACPNCGKRLKPHAVAPSRFEGPSGPPPTEPYPWMVDSPPPVVGFPKCWRCGSSQLPQIKERISMGGVVTLLAMCILCFPLFWIGLLLKEQYQVCSKCGAELTLG